MCVCVRVCVCVCVLERTCLCVCVCAVGVCARDLLSTINVFDCAFNVASCFIKILIECLLIVTFHRLFDVIVDAEGKCLYSNRQ